MLPPRVHLITDRDICPDLVSAARAALGGLPAGAVAVHLREKALGGARLLALAREIVAVAHGHGQLAIVNERADVALAAHADGVHLPASAMAPADARRLLGAGALVGVSCHSAADVRRARDGGADYATFGPVFETPSKRPYGAPVGLAALSAAVEEGLPLIGLGGINLENAPSVLEAGAFGIAAIRAWLGAEPGSAVRALTRMTTRPPPHEHHHGPGHAGGPRDRHGNPEDLDAYIARIESEDRLEWQRPDDVLAALGVEPGQVVADVGAGPGYFSMRLAAAVGERGRVFAVDVEPEMLEVLRERIARHGVINVTPVLGAADDPRLPEPCDLVLVVNAVHHVHDPRAYLRTLATALTAGGRIAVIDFHAGELPVGPPPEHKLSREDLLDAARGAGLRVVKEETFLQHQYFVVLARS